MGVTKTTFHLPDSIRTKLKTLAARRDTTVTELLTEGAKLVLAQYQHSEDRDELARRAGEARESLRRGLYRGPAVAVLADDLVYPSGDGRRADVRAFFYDTWAFLGLANSGDPHHDLCADADRALEAAGYAAVTSDYILDETLTGLHVAAGARVALAFADGLFARIEGRDVLLVEMTSDLRASALTTFRRLAPAAPRLSFTDCTSFVVMRELGIDLAFTADRHFQRAGGRIRPLVEEKAGALTLRLPPH